MARYLLQQIDHGGGAFGSIPDVSQYEEGGVEWCLRYACDGNNYALQAASVVATFDYLLSEQVTAKEAMRRLRQMRRSRRERWAETREATQ